MLGVAVSLVGCQKHSPLKYLVYTNGINVFVREIIMRTIIGFWGI